MLIVDCLFQLRSTIVVSLPTKSSHYIIRRISSCLYALCIISCPKRIDGKKANREKREKERGRKGRGREEEERKWSLFNLVFARCFCVKVSRRRRTGERKDKKKKKKYHERDFSTVLPTKDSSYNGMSSCIRQQKKEK